MLERCKLRELVDYNQYTGWLTWKIKKARSRVKIGCRAGYRHNSGYRYVKIDGHNYLEARLIFFWMTGRWPDPEIDHENRIRDDNRWENLREATSTENKVNRPNKKLAGIRLSKNGTKFEAYASLKHRHLHLGSFDTLEEAISVRNDFMNTNFGEFYQK